jgi:hypothetical protein
MTLQDRLDALVPEHGDERGDWDEVLARGAAERTAPRAVKRGVVIALVVAAAVAVPAIVAAVLSRTNVIFSTSKPAPNIVKKRFSDLGFGAPPRFAVGIQAGKAREIGSLRVRGRRTPVWVAPTREGGFCVLFERGFGGCTPRGPRRRILSASYDAGQSVSALGGWIATRAPNARIKVEYADGSHDDVPYIYVSAPIAAGFFWFDVPKEHETPKTRLVEVAVEDGTGRRLAHERMVYVPTHARVHVGPPPPPGQYVPRALPARSNVPPSAPLQRGSGNGVTVTAGSNGVVLFDLRGIDADARRLVDHGHASLGYGCFKLVREFGIFDAKGMGFQGRFAPTAAVRIFGLPKPWDGCDIQGSYGHRWPDRNGSHSAVEIPLTPKGRRYFADRAAARDLALFVRTARMQQIRKMTGAQLLAALDPYPILQLGTARDPLPIGTIGYAPTADGVTFVKRSITGRRFVVEVRDRKIRKQNLKPYAFVF